PTASRLAPPPLRNQIRSSAWKEEALAVVDRRPQGRASLVGRPNLRGSEHALDQRLAQLRERQRIVEERRIQHALRDGEFVALEDVDAFDRMGRQEPVHQEPPETANWGVRVRLPVQS